MDTDVLIIGAGTSGLTAAKKLLSFDLDITILDQFFEPGGRLKNLPYVINNLSEDKNITGTRYIKDLLEDIKSEGGKILTNHCAIGNYKDNSIGVTNGSVTFPLHAKRILLTTGSVTETYLFPGWTLPGVFTIEAIYHLLNREKIELGNKMFLVGLNSSSISLIKNLISHNIQVVGIVDVSDNLGNISDAEYQYIKEKKIKIIPFHNIFRVGGEEKVQYMETNQEGKLLRDKIDFVVVNGNRNPVIELFQLLGCKMKFRHSEQAWIPYISEDFQTTKAYIYAAGSVLGLKNEKAIAFSGGMAGISIAASLGKMDERSVYQSLKENWDFIGRTEQGYSYIY